MRGNFVTDRKGMNNPRYKDGRKNTRLYSIYYNMITRCYNTECEQYRYYGERGIVIYDKWLEDYVNFYEWAITNGYDDNLTLDRIDVNGDYEPNNCRWVSRKKQCNNKRNNHYVVHNNEKRTLSEWCEICHINYSTVQDRLRRGWGEVEALTVPSNRKFAGRWCR